MFTGCVTKKTVRLTCFLANTPSGSFLISQNVFYRSVINLFAIRGQ